ncbi:TPA: 6-phospho-3-hexuloisomerase [Klebsiella oxytoca]|nr:6-phospho-3-hexuloisomerase [Klebsiella oxytoca]
MESIVDDMLSEISICLMGIPGNDVESFLNTIKKTNRVFMLGAGRSGLVVKMAAMRLMHLGCTVHVVGETTCPSIQSGDTLLIVSGSGKTPGIITSAIKAEELGAKVISVTCNSSSLLSQHVHQQVVLKAAIKDEHENPLSIQFAGTLFEQSALLFLDSIFHALWKKSGQAASALWSRHTNME